MSNNIDQKVREILLEEYRGITELRDEMNKHFFEIRSHNLLQRRDLMKHISLISAAILGLLSLGINDEVIKSYFFIGISFHALAVIFVVTRLREQIDADAEALKSRQDEYNALSVNKRNIIEKYFRVNNSLDEKILKEYFDELKRDKKFEQFAKEPEAAGKKKENRNLLDFTSEITIFSFVTGSFFVMMALFNQHVTGYTLTALLLAFFVISFTGFSTAFTRFTGWLLIPLVVLVRHFNHKNGDISGTFPE